MNKNRPINLNLFTIYFPIPSIISILHRLTGLFLFLFVPFLIWGVNVSLTHSGFETIQSKLDHVFVKIVIWLLFIPLFVHLLAGIRHLFADFHLGDTLPAGRTTAWIVLLAALLLIILAGVWIW